MRLTNAYAVTLDEKHIIVICWSQESAEKWKGYYSKDEVLKLHKLSIVQVSVEDPAQYISELATEAGLNPDDNIDLISPIAVAVRAMQQINMLSFIEMAKKYLKDEYSVSYTLPFSESKHVIYISPLSEMLKRIKGKE